MASVALLLDVSTDSLAIGPASAEALVRLGVTGVSLYRDGRSTCIVLEGWAFDAHGAAAAAAALGVADTARILGPVVQAALRAGPDRGSSDDQSPTWRSLEP